MTGPREVFAGTYNEARSQFLEAAAAAGLRVESHAHPRVGSEGEPLAMDVVREGPADAQALLIVSSGCHGVEGFCGSGIQIDALRDGAWHEHLASRGVAVLFVHALNPYGFSHLHRTTHENIDLNRNFIDFSRPLPRNEDYREVHPLLVPPEWPPTAANVRAIEEYIATRGMHQLQSAVSSGQHEFADGLFFGGQGPSWSNLTIREVLRTHARRARRLAWIDIHTGLGPEGHGERIFGGRNDRTEIDRARAWWGGGGATPVTSIFDGSSSSAYLTGMLCHSVYDECPEAEFTSVALEFGTVPLMETLQALRADQWRRLHPQAPAALVAQIRREMKDAFFVDTPHWKQRVLEQGREVMAQAVEGLAAR